MLSILTDGNEWRLYFSQTGGEFRDKCFRVLQLLTEDVSTLESDFRKYLSKQALVAGEARRAAEESLRESQVRREMNDMRSAKAADTHSASAVSCTAQAVPCSGSCRTRRSAVPGPSVDVSFHASDGAACALKRSRASRARPSAEKSPVLNAVHSVDPPVTDERIVDVTDHHDPDLRFTKVISAAIGPEAASNWNDLVEGRLGYLVSSEPKRTGRATIVR